MDMSPFSSHSVRPQAKPADITQILSNRARRRARLALERSGTGPVGSRIRRASALATDLDLDVDSEADTQARFLQQAMLLDWLGQPPLSFHRVFVDITGNVLAALWLSHALDRRGDAGNFGEPPLRDDLIFQMTAAQCEEETGITRAQQVTCRRVLTDKGLLSEDGSQGKTLRYRIHKDRLLACLLEQATPLAQALRQANDIELAGSARSGRGNAQGPR